MTLSESLALSSAWSPANTTSRCGPRSDAVSSRRSLLMNGAAMSGCRDEVIGVAQAGWLCDDGKGRPMKTTAPMSTASFLRRTAEVLVLPDRIELSTSPLPMECSTTELRQHAGLARIGLKAATKPGGSCHKVHAHASAAERLCGERNRQKGRKSTKSEVFRAWRGHPGPIRCLAPAFPLPCGRLEARPGRRTHRHQDLPLEGTAADLAPNVPQGELSAGSDDRRQHQRRAAREGIAAGPAEACAAGKSEAAQGAGAAARPRRSFGPALEPS
jgi:hypothetical protein